MRSPIGDGRPSTPALIAGGLGLAAAGALAWRFRPGESLEGRVALVTGGSRGLGFLIARRLLDEGCRVAICARDPETLDTAANRLASRGEVVACRCDVGDRASIQRMVDDVIDRFGRIDILVNNAMVIQVGALDTMRRKDFEDAMAMGFWGVYDATMAVLPHMRRNGGGAIANITSIGAKVAIPHLLPYDCAKFAAIGLSEGLRAELARDDIAVTTIVPGLMRTGSPVHVEYRGQPEKEYAWFALGDITPLSAMSAQRAARRIVRAIRRREAEVVLTWQAKTLRLVHDLAPGFTARATAVANRLLPDPVSKEARARANAQRQEAGAGPRREPGTTEGTAGARAPRRRRAPQADSAARRPRTARGEELRGTLPGVVERALDRAGERANQ